MHSTKEGTKRFLLGYLDNSSYRVEGNLDQALRSLERSQAASWAGFIEAPKQGTADTELIIFLALFPHIVKAVNGHYNLFAASIRSVNEETKPCPSLRVHTERIGGNETLLLPEKARIFAEKLDTPGKLLWGYQTS